MKHRHRELCSLIDDCVQRTQGTVLCVACEVLVSPCFPVKSANFPAENTTREGSGPPGKSETVTERQHIAPLLARVSSA